MDELSLNDIIQIYKDTLCLYNGVPVKVQDVNPDKKVRIFNLMSQRSVWVKFEFDKFSAPKGRLGYVNVMGHAIYVCRTPVRRFSNGITRNNVSVKCNEGERGDVVRYAADLVQDRTNPAFISAIFGEYPTQQEAIQDLKDNEAVSVAFDRQFAVGMCEESIALFYRSTYVARYDEDAKAFAFNNSSSHLKNLLETHYGKAAV